MLLRLSGGLGAFPERRLRARNMPEVTGVRQGGKLSRSGLRLGYKCSLSRRCFDVTPARPSGSRKHRSSSRR
ncbi:hypothetical protein NK6_8226 [Bradyrhizobium diazoefficiens]|uniref:Uncharacterized protein n=2 Tax=Bradyrhizobium diazoefficiens TaxID=1355477 RepID=A0A837CJT2_9BRAD|nr:hypothetical protein BJA5080_04650 [Bradyrhizobium diazoefficiens SEMIA 5080]BAR61375.1 hypothetical protein NK6_8226 [Bradyrhizobium diazoefficiens]